MKKSPPFQFGLREAIVAVLLIGVVMGVGQWSPTLRSILSGLIVVLTVTAAGLGALFESGRTRVCCAGAMIAMGAALLLRLTRDRGLDPGWFHWEDSDREASTATISNMLTLAFAVAGAVMGLLVRTVTERSDENRNAAATALGDERRDDAGRGK